MDESQCNLNGETLEAGGDHRRTRAIRAMHESSGFGP